MNRDIVPGLNHRIVVVSNRLPIIIEKVGGENRVRASAGGLVTAISPVMEKEGGLWIGWLGGDESQLDAQALDQFHREHTYELCNVALTTEEVDQYYNGFSNAAVWPLFHDLIGYAVFELEHWHAYNEVNRRFAEVIRDAIGPDDFIWIHDYQLMLVAHHLRRMGVNNTIGFFLHIPFPSEDLLRRLPWYRRILGALMQCDLLGFQSRRDQRNFTDCVLNLEDDPDDNASTDAVLIEENERYSTIEYAGRIVKAGHYPISIDFDEFNEPASSEKVKREANLFREEFVATTLVLGVDRLDYTKGIPQRFLAFERALEKYEDLRGNISLFQLVIPSRTQIEAYQNLKSELDLLVGRINGRFYRKGWIPIYYMYGRLNRTQLLGRYRACEIALITPLRDGMNLVAKEYCASQHDNNGVLILSEFAGTAEQLTEGPLIVNPFDREGTADTIHRAYHMDPEKRGERMIHLRNQIRRDDVHRWVNWFFSSLDDKTAATAPIQTRAGT